MKKLSRILSVGLSLVMCASMVAPGFAAGFADLQNVIDTKTSLKGDDGNDRIGYDNGTVRLYEDVVCGGQVKTITVKKGTDVTIDLNGNNIDGNGKSSAVITVNAGGTLTLKDGTAHTETDEEGNERYESGTITGSNSRGVYNNGTFIMESGAITGNTAKGRGAGVDNEKGTFIMNGGEISGNTATGYVTSHGGGVANVDGTFTMNGGAITNNTSSKGDGGGVYTTGAGSTFTMNGGVISGNKTDGSGFGRGGGVYNIYGTFTMNGGTITDNRATQVGGGVHNSGGTFIMKDGAVIEGNTSWSRGDEIHSSSDGITLPEDSLWVSDTRAASDGQVYSGKEINSGSVSYVDLRHHTHNFTKEEIMKQPTCTEAGEKVKSGCVCGQTVTETIPALGHDMGDWHVTREAKPGVDGEERRDCQREGCGYFETRPISDSEKPDPEKPDPVKPDPTDPTDPGKTDPTDPGKTDPTDPGKTDPTDPTDSTDPTVEVDEPDVPLADEPETSDSTMEIDEPETPLGDVPEMSDSTVEIDGPNVPLGDVPQTGEASTAMWLAVLLACGMGLVYVNTGKRKENA